VPAVLVKEGEELLESGVRNADSLPMQLFKLVSLEDARKRRFDFVLVWALDRLSREGPLVILTLVNRLKICGVKVISYQESWTEAPGELGELLYALSGWVARMESQRRSERTKAGLARVKAQGRKLGRPRGSGDKKKRRRRVISPSL